jgi:hypothetical protein
MDSDYDDRNDNGDAVVNAPNHSIAHADHHSLATGTGRKSAPRRQVGHTAESPTVSGSTPTQARPTESRPTS